MIEKFINAPSKVLCPIKYMSFGRGNNLFSSETWVLLYLVLSTIILSLKWSQCSSLFHRLCSSQYLVWNNSLTKYNRDFHTFFDWISKLDGWPLFIGAESVLAMKRVLLRKLDDWKMLGTLLNSMLLSVKIDNKNFILIYEWFKSYLGSDHAFCL